MGIQYSEADKFDWQTIPGDDVRFKTLTRDLVGAPGVGLIEYGPGRQDKEHSHATHEVLFIFDGEAIVGEQRFGPNTMVYIEKGTRYAPKAGPNGLKFLRVEIPG